MTNNLKTYRVTIECLVDAETFTALQARIDDETPGQILESASDIYVSAQVRDVDPREDTTNELALLNVINS